MFEIIVTYYCNGYVTESLLSETLAKALRTAALFLDDPTTVAITVRDDQKDWFKWAF